MKLDGGWVLINDQQSVSRRMFLREAGLLGAGVAAASVMGCDSSTGPKGPPRGELIVLQSGSPHVQVFDPLTNQLLRKADIPNFLRWSHNDDNNYFDGTNLWLGAMTPIHGPPGFEGNEILLLDLDKLVVTARVPLGKEGTTANPTTGVTNAMLNIGKPTRGGRLLVGKMFMGEVVVMDVNSRAEVISKKLLAGPDWVCDTDFSLADDGKPRQFVATNNTGKVLSIDPGTLGVTATYVAATGIRPYMLTTAPDGNRVWVQNFFAAGYTGERFGVTVLDAKTLAVVKQIDTGLIPFNVGFSPDGRLAYVTHSDGTYITVVDTISMAEVRRVEAGGAASAIAVHPDGRSIFIRVNGTENYLVRVNTATWQVGPRFAVTSVRNSSGLYMRRLG